MIESGLAEHGDARAAWARIRIEPERWRCSPWGDDGGGFWAVAEDGDQVLWFNDIEGGFNWSRFSERGTIGEYGCNQDSFEDVLAPMARAHRDQLFARLPEGDPPPGLAGPGTIVRRQTTYWEARAATGALYRAHFRDKAEATVVAPEYAGVELLSRHPLLVDHTESWQSVYFRGTPLHPRALADRLGAVVQAASDGWRDLSTYAGRPHDVERFLRAGYGCLMRAPRSVCAVVAAALEDAGISTSILADARAPQALRVLLFGRSYVIANRFVFERRDEGA